MWDAFSADTSGFKRKIYIYILITIMALAAAYGFNMMRSMKAAENIKLAATYTAQSDWLNQIDYDEMDALYKAVLKPVKANQIDKVQQEQLDILRNHNIVVESVRNDNDKTNKKKAKLKSVTTKVSMQGNWDNLTAALNEFEKRNLVVITELDISPDSKTGLIEAKMGYNIYYQ